MTRPDRPSWQLPPGVSRGLWDYVHASHIADDYDEYFAFNSLFETDGAILRRQFDPPGLVADLGCGTGRALVHVVLRRRGMTPRFLPPVSVVFAGARDRYVAALTRFRESGIDGVAAWIEHFAAAVLRSARLARAYVTAVRELQERWRGQLRAAGPGRMPRADAAAWAVIDLLPAHPLISAPVATAVTGRAKSRVYEGIEQLVAAGVLLPLSSGRRNRWWEADGLLDLVAQLEDGTPPVAPSEGEA